MTLSTQILIGLASGIACGLFFGEYCGHLKFLGDAFIGLLQMTVLPYIVVSLIANIGRLSVEQSRRLLTVGGKLLAVFLAIGAVALVAIPLSFPEVEAASFFSRSMLEPRQEIDLVGLYVPTNPFHSLSSGIVPAVVIFCIFAGVGLMTVRGKEDVIRLLDTASDALIRVNKIVVRLTPIGVFAIAASAAGTMTLEEIGRLQAYLLCYTVAAAVLAFVVLPAMVAFLTPFRFTDVFRVTRGTLLMIFVTGKIIVVLPQLIENVKQLFREQAAKPDADDYQDAGILVPLIYPFPNLGTFVIFVFIPFTAWFLGNAMSMGDYPLFLGATLLVSFVAPVVGIPFLLDLMKLPADMFHLFVVSSVYTDRVRVVLGGMNVFVFSVLAVAVLHGVFRIQWRKLATYAATSLALAVVCIVGVRALLDRTLASAYTKDEVIAGMQMLTPSTEETVLEEAVPNPVPLEESQSLIERIRRRGVLRFGYDRQKLPFCFFNARGELVGFDIELMRHLARTLDVRLELVPVTRQTLREQAEQDHFDVAGCGFTLTSARSAQLTLSEPYLDLSAALVVPDYRRHEFDSLDKIRSKPDLTIGVVTDGEFAAALAEAIPGSRVVRMDSLMEFFSGDTTAIDALFTSAEAGSAITLLFPDYTVVNPSGKVVALPLVLVLSQQDQAAKQFLNSFLLVCQKNGLIDQLYEHWILGITAEQHGPRWSVGHDVLGWLP